MTAVLHDVRVGHTTFLDAPLRASFAVCLPTGKCRCRFAAWGDHVRADGVHHACEDGHAVLVGEGRAVTVIEVTS